MKFSIRVHFRDDFAYIDFGCPWSSTAKYGTGILDGSEDTTPQSFIENFVLLGCHFISKEDAKIILNELFQKDETSTETPSEPTEDEPSVEEEIMTTELIDEDGTVIAL